MQTFCDLLDRVAARGDEAVLCCGHETLSGADFVRRVQKATEALRALGVRKGSRVAAWVPNEPMFIVLQFATTCLGAVFVPIHTRYGARELCNILRRARPLVLFYRRHVADLDLSATLAEALGMAAVAPRVVALDEAAVGEGTSWGPIGQGAPEAPLPTTADAVSPADTAVCIFTSGTTGQPKGALLSHGAILATETRVADVLQVARGERLLYGAPLASVFGCCNAVVAAWSRDACLVVLPAFTAEAALDAIEQHGCSILYAVPTMCLMLLQHPLFEPSRTATLRTGIIGGAPSAPELIRDVIHRLGASQVVSGYGMSETCAVTTLTRIGSTPEAVAYSVGTPLPGVEVRIVDTRVSDRLVDAAEGEICIRGPNLMQGYLLDDGEVSRPFTDGWFRSGDIGRLDADGCLRITGRLSELILVGGFNVYPAEVELALAEHPAVLQAHVVGAPHERLGEQVVAFVQWAPEHEFEPRHLQEYCRGRIARYKVPAQIIRVDAFPLTPLGKVRKPELRAMAARAVAAQDPEQPRG